MVASPIVPLAATRVNKGCAIKLDAATLHYAAEWQALKTLALITPLIQGRLLAAADIKRVYSDHAALRIDARRWCAAWDRPVGYKTTCAGVNEKLITINL